MSIVLQKKGAQHQMQFQKTESGAVKILLKWSNDAPVDLDLGCYYELRNGKRCLIDPLQFMGGNGGPKDSITMQGCYTYPPYIWHTGDDRGNNTSSQETIIVNSKGLLAIRRIVVYAYIYEGVGKWRETDAVVNIVKNGHETVTVRMGEVSDTRRFCAIAQLDFDKDSSVTVKRLVTFHDNHSECDRKYGWGFNYNHTAKE